MEDSYYKHAHRTRMELCEVYFWTNTIKDWRHLLAKDAYKHLIIEQLQWLRQRHKIKIYGFVIMPNHIHLVWELLEKNGKEMPHASFNKWTSSNFLKDLRINYPHELSHHQEKTAERNHRFWQKNPLGILINSQTKAERVLDYIHLNPLQEHWNLSKTPEEYFWSSAQFYETGEDRFHLLTHYRDRF